MVGAFVGGLLGGHIPGQILLIAFALMMVATFHRHDPRTQEDG
jgi:uncharacterized membrane protein YfcA